MARPKSCITSRRASIRSPCIWKSGKQYEKGSTVRMQKHGDPEQCRGPKYYSTNLALGRTCSCQTTRFVGEEVPWNYLRKLGVAESWEKTDWAQESGKRCPMVYQHGYGQALPCEKCWLKNFNCNGILESWCHRVCHNLKRWDWYENFVRNASEAQK